MKHPFPTLSRHWLILSILIPAWMLSTMQVHAQRQQWYSNPYLNNRNEIKNCIMQTIDADMASRFQPRKVLSTAHYLMGNDNLQMWTNGIYLYQTDYDAEEHEIYCGLDPIHGEHDDYIVYPHFKVNGKTVTLSHLPNVKVSVEQIAGHIMLVGRNHEGKPVFSLYNVNEEMQEDRKWTLLAHYYMMGNYILPDSNTVVFGPKMEFYTGNQYNTDPGIIEGYHIDKRLQSIEILYGNGRVSRGNPRNPNWGKMPGGGGTAAIMGPMEWSITPSTDGLTCVILNDEPFVEHSPAIGQEGDTVTLTKVQCPYEGLPGKWTFASVIPLTHTMLQLFPKEVLTLMRGEIFARYGDTFKDPATQRYFDAQPWYKPSDKPIHITDVERFNYDLIKSVEFSK